MKFDKELQIMENVKRRIIQLVIIAVIALPEARSQDNFYAYYTKINSGKNFEISSRTGEHADLVINLGIDDKQLIFWRASSYLPFLRDVAGDHYLEELIPRSGDGDGVMPDKFNKYSRVKLVEASDDQIIVHWRYAPDLQNVSLTDFVDEYFILYPDGRLIRSFRPGREKYDDWADPGNLQVRSYDLSDNQTKGIPLAAASADNGSKQAGQNREAVTFPAAKLVEPVSKPLVWFRMDEGKGESTREEFSSAEMQISGDKPLWRTGVSGSGLVFNGWSSEVILPVEHSPFLDKKYIRDTPQYEFSMEAWIAIKAYPWNWCPIVQQCIMGKNGYFLGLDYYGHLGFKAAIGGSWFELISKETLPRNQWVHVAATYNHTHGLMKIYVDGKLIGEKETSGRELYMDRKQMPVEDLRLKIGKGDPMKPALPIRPYFTDVSGYAFDGMIDEVKVYDKELSALEVRQTYESYQLTGEQKNAPDLQERVLPGNIEREVDFGAYYTRLKFYETWDNRWRVGDDADVVVEFGELPVKFVFWRGTSYIPHWVTENNKWATQEFTESRTSYGCAEPMSDKESRHSHVRIIENTPARVVIHWRYAMVDVKYNGAYPDEKTGWTDWTDEYHYLYPDGTGVRIQNAWSNIPFKREWHEGIILNGPEQRPEDNIEWDAMTLGNMKGESHTYSWLDGPPQGQYWEEAMPLPEGRNIAVMNLKSEYDPFIIGPPGDDVIIAAYNDKREFTRYSKFSWFNHWPMSYVISDGHHAHTVDRTTSTSMFWLDTRENFYEKRENMHSKIYLHGMTKTGVEGLADLAKAWVSPPKIKKLQGAKEIIFDQSQKAFIVDSDESDLSFNINASEENPLLNPCFIIRNWQGGSKAVIELNGETLPEDEYRQGIIRDTKGNRQLVVWLDYKSNEKTMWKILNKAGGT
jgi:hypothetical protein